MKQRVKRARKNFIASRKKENHRRLAIALSFFAFCVCTQAQNSLEYQRKKISILRFSHSRLSTHRESTNSRYNEPRLPVDGASSRQNIDFYWRVQEVDEGQSRPPSNMQNILSSRVISHAHTKLFFERKFFFCAEITNK